MYKIYIKHQETLKFTQKKSEVFYFALVNFIFLYKKKRYKNITLIYINPISTLRVKTILKINII